MRYAIISDIHGNLQALESTLAIINRLGVDEIRCLGDIVGYGAKPVECTNIIKESCSLVLMGNHDSTAIGKSSIDYFNPIARSAMEWTMNALSDEEIAYLGTLPLLHEEDVFSATHATFSHPENWDYIFSPLDAAIEFNSCNDRILFYGHTHYPVVFTLDGNEVNRQQVDELNLEKDKRYLINVGSVGQPRDGNPDACFLIYDNQTDAIQFHRVSYDIEACQSDILNTRIPGELALRLSYGR